MLETKDVYFYNAEIKLSGKLFINMDDLDKKSIVILSVGFGATKEMLVKKAIDICEGGNHVFTYDYQGHGGSEGIAGHEMISDLFAAIDYVKNTISNDLPIILGGQCMGALFSLNAAAQRKDVTAVFGMSLLLESAITLEKWEFIVEVLSSKQEGHHCIFDQESLLQDFQKNDIKDTLKELEGLPVLLIHFENDDIMPIDMILQTFLQSPCEKNILILDKGRHVDSYICNTFNDILVSWINEKKERWFMTAGLGAAL
ncbi:alpha/beta hydrolase [Paenibacillus sp. CGMCC 1.18879]|uniref:alpha/beta hydrolase n=1 Tax=Paenibacillus sp. CGMCC 1.18879 TaxID=2834466 RepID=UPI001CA7BCBD|nr:alpha/beta fold hydrolase [Paenibacillus sp. CGMCC 1.18879]MBY9081316.1 alpha/beta hydrolase [Paenibacillus sp. CGMCC 1.18879]